MKAFSIKLPPDLARRAKELKEKSGISEAAILRQAIEAGLSQVERGVAVMRAPATTEEVAA